MINIEVKVSSKLPAWMKGKEKQLDMALADMAYQMNSMAKVQVPQKTSRLQGSGQYRKEGSLHYVVEFNTEYAGYQEYGQRADGSHKVKNYSTPGTKKHYLKDPGETIQGKVDVILKRYL